MRCTISRAASWSSSMLRSSRSAKILDSALGIGNHLVSCSDHGPSCDTPSRFSSYLLITSSGDSIGRGYSTYIVASEENPNYAIHWYTYSMSTKTTPEAIASTRSQRNQVGPGNKWKNQAYTMPPEWGEKIGCGHLFRGCEPRQCPSRRVRLAGHRPGARIRRIRRACSCVAPLFSAGAIG